MGTEREKYMKARLEDGEGLCYMAYGLCEETDVSVWIPPWDEQTDVCRGCTGMLRISGIIQTLSYDILSSLYHHHVLFIPSSRLTVTIPPESFIILHLIPQTPFFTAFVSYFLTFPSVRGAVLWPFPMHVICMYVHSLFVWFLFVCASN